MKQGGRVLLLHLFLSNLKKEFIYDVTTARAQEGSNFTDESPHSTYDCRSNLNAKCGERAW